MKPVFGRITVTVPIYFYDDECAANCPHYHRNSTRYCYLFYKELAAYGGAALRCEECLDAHMEGEDTQ